MHSLLYSVPPTRQQATVNPHLHWRLLNTHRQVLPALLWRHCSFLLAPGAHKVLLVPSKYQFPRSVEVCNQILSSVQFSSVAQSFPTLCDPMTCSTPGLPVHHHLPEFTQTHIHRDSEAVQPSHPLSSPSPPAPNPSQCQTHLYVNKCYILFLC